MGKPDPKTIAAKNAADQAQVYDDEKISGHMAGLDSDDNAADALREVLGNNPKHNLNIGEEINKDEQSLTTKPDGTEDPVVPTDSLDNLDPQIVNINAAGVSENLEESTEDPFDKLTDADLGIKKKAA